MYNFQNLFINFIGCEDFLFPKICLNGINLKRLKAVQHGKIADICAVWLRALSISRLVIFYNVFLQANNGWLGFVNSPI